VADEIKRMDIAEFRRLGYLQEINRRVLHPAGLALEILHEADGTERFGGVWDYRDDPEGIIYEGDLADLAPKAALVEAEIDKHREARAALLGAVIQPINPAGT